MPGIIDCHSHIAAEAINEGSVSVSSMVSIEDVINPEDIAIYRALAGGVTTANILHGSANSIGGKCSVIKTRWGKDASGLIFEGSTPGIKFALGENPKRSGATPVASGGRARYPATRMGVEDVIREAFNDAKVYQANWREYNEKVKRHENAIPPRRDLKLEPLVEVLEGKRFVHAHCYRADEILMLLRVADDYGFKIRTLQHVLEGYKVAKEIAAHGAGASTFSDWWSYKIEAYDAIPFNAAIMVRKGVLVSLNSDDAELMRHLNTEAAKTMKYGGLSETEALSLVTINPAKQLAVDSRVGSIEVGKDADLAIYDKHPLSNYAKVQKVLIDGSVYFDRDKEQSEQGKKDVREEDADREREAATAALQYTIAETDMRQLLASLVLAWPLMADSNNSFLLRNIAIHPVSGPDIANGSILVENGKIADIGSRLGVPKGVRVIDGKGLHAYPGMIDSATQVGLSEIGSIRETNDTNELGDFNPQLKALVAVNPESEHLPVTRANGITSVITMPASGGGGGGRGGGGNSILIAGQAALIHLDGWTWEDLEVRRDAAMQLIFPTLETRTVRFETMSVNRTPFAEVKTAYDKRLKELNDFFETARRYQYAKNAHSPEFRSDLKLESMIPVLEGKMPVMIAATRERAIRDAIQFADKQKIRIVLAGPREFGKTMPEIKAKGIPVIAPPTLALPMEEDDPYDAAFTLPAELYKAGIKFAFGSFTVQFSRNLPYQAATAVAFGLPYQEALKAVTLNAAEIWGVSDQLGSIEKGKWADLTLTDGDPLEAQTHIRQMFIKGRSVDLASKHTRLYEKYMARP